MPAVIGGGLGDIEETLAAGRRLARAGFPVTLYRRPGSPLPKSVDGPWDWPPLARVDRPVRAGRSALTVTPAWGLSGAPSRPGPYGRGGPWSTEVADLEAAYGPDRVLHVSLEEFARTLSPGREQRERFREGGIRSRALAGSVREARTRQETETYVEAFRRFRAFDHPRVLHVFATFAPDRGFARSWPASVQVGPLWPERYRSRPAPHRPRRPEWLWYASPASAERLLLEVIAGLQAADPIPHLTVVSPRPWSVPLPIEQGRLIVGSLASPAWEARFRRASLRIVTGSRTLLEAMELGGPFLYFNGVLGSGVRRRRHRPEKLRSLLAFATDAGMTADVRKDLSDFASGRRVRDVVRRAARRSGGWTAFPRRWPVGPFSPTRRNAGDLVVHVARALEAGRPAAEIVARVRSGRAP